MRQSGFEGQLSRKEAARQERRARRQVRREKQRLANRGRGQKMHAARLVAGLPSPPSWDEELPLLNVGCSGWFYWHWRTLFYKTKPIKDWFSYYRRHFSTVELNAPFYSWPTINTVKTWVKQAGENDFVYTVKVCELITHVKRFRGTKTLVQDFGFVADLLQKRFGCFLFQLPPSYRYTPARLRTILEQLEISRRNVVEFRHSSWWNENVYTAFKKVGAIFCSCSAPKLPDTLIATNAEVYIRFHGSTKWYRHDYSPQELALWAKRVKESGCRRVWAYFNNDRDAYALKNAKQFLVQLKKMGLGGKPK